MKLWKSNDDTVCENKTLENFRHVLTKRYLINFSALMNCKSLFVTKPSYCFIVESDFASMLNVFLVVYGVENFFSNNCDAIFCKVNFDQLTEPSTMV